MPTLLSPVSTDNSIAVTQQLLKNLQVPFTFLKIKEALKQHPDYPSIAATHDVLKEYKVENLVLKVEPDKLNELPLPFIAHIKGKDAGFITIANITESEVVYYKKDSLSTTLTKKRDAFLKDWSGVTLLAEKTEQSGERNYSANRKKERIEKLRIPLLAASVLGIILFSLVANPQLSFALLSITILKFAGVIVTGLLVWYEIDKHNPFLQKVCSGGKATNCNAILQSKEAKLFGIISWSEIGFFYFAGGLLFLVIPRNEGSAQLLAWLNLLALPYTLFSIYYQWRIAKQWCPLCLAVQALLLTEATMFFAANYHQPLTNNLLTYNSITIAFLTPVLIWYFIKPFLVQAKQGEEYKNRFFRMKKDSRIFEALLAKQKKITVSADGLGITLGNPNATNTIIKVCSPYCKPCSKAHLYIHEILKNNNDVKVQVIFNSTPDVKDYRSFPVKHLMAIYKQESASEISKALDDWYLPEKKDYELLASKYSIDSKFLDQNFELSCMHNWCEKVKIDFTPTFFINGYQLPDNYSVEDISYFI